MKTRMESEKKTEQILFSLFVVSVETFHTLFVQSA